MYLLHYSQHLYNVDDYAGSLNSAEAVFSSCCTTIIQQSHLSPVPLKLRPTYRQFDNAFQMHPQPDLLILADQSQSQIHMDVKGVTCLCPVCTQSPAMFTEPLQLYCFLDVLYVKTPRSCKDQLNKVIFRLLRLVSHITLSITKHGSSVHVFILWILEKNILSIAGCLHLK